VLLHPYAPTPPTIRSQGFGAQLRHTMPPWQGASIINHLDYILPREGHRVAHAMVHVEFRTQVGDPEIMKLFIMSQSLSLCLIGYAWFR
jgi:hypothetical protein